MPSPNGTGSATDAGLSDPAELLRRQGFALVANVLPDPLRQMQAMARISLSQGAVGGSRCLLDQPWCAELAQRLREHPQIALLLPPEMVAVQCTYFEKSRDRNWLVTVHQDLSIPVAARIASEAWRGWSFKEGCLFAQPPLAVLQSLLALRLHLDPCGPEDGALRFVPASHELGVLSEVAAIQQRDLRGEVLCPAQPGDVIAMKPLTLHASSKSRGGSRRRVLHFLFGPRALPDGARWARQA